MDLLGIQVRHNDHCFPLLAMEEGLKGFAPETERERVVYLECLRLRVEVIKMMSAFSTRLAVGVQKETVDALQLIQDQLVLFQKEMEAVKALDLK